MSARFGRTFVSLPRPLSAHVRANLVKQGYEIDDVLGVAQRFEPGEVDLDDPSETDPWAEAFEHVWYVGVHERDDVFVYTHRVWGALVRSLVFCGNAAGWATVVGDPEPWEARFLLSPAELERGEAYLALAGFTDAVDRAQKLAALRRVHEGGLSPARKGQMLPSCSPDGWAAAIPGYFLRGAGSTPGPEPVVSTPAPPVVVAPPVHVAPPPAADSGAARRAQLEGWLAAAVPASDLERARAAREALKTFPDLIPELRRRGAIPPRRLPEDERPWDASNPVNQESVAFPTDEGRIVAAISADTAELAAAFAGSDKRRIVLALELLETLAAYDPEAAGTLEPNLRPLLRDGRSPEYGPGIPTVRAVNGFFARALPVHAAVYARSPSPWEALLIGMDAAIAANVVPWLARHFLRLTEARIDAARVAGTLVAWIEDRAKPPATRARARDVLTLLADNGGGPSARPNAGRPWPDGPAALKRGNDAALRVLGDPTESEELRSRIKNALGKWIPGAVS